MIRIKSRVKPLIFTLVILSFLTACKNIPDQHLYTGNITEKQLIDGITFLGEPLNDSDLPEENVMKLTPEMETFLKENVLNAKGTRRKAIQLSKAIFHEDLLGLVYDPRMTLTADQAFKFRVANCLAFSYLYSSLAKKAGLKVRFQEVHLMPEWDYSENEIFVENRHVNVRVDLSNREDLVVDINKATLDDHIDFTILDDDHVIALYYGNVAAEYLLKGDHEKAYKYSVKAINTDPDEAAFWTNLGVLFRRAGNVDLAEKAYFVALSHDGENKASLNNLSTLYLDAGDEVRSAYYGDMVKKY
ncbi:MAG: hypothetical protein P8H03_06960 [Emcibacteraceae bacterium]|nr:hypothetical protein [Emcibacteraceae bacterium]MDG1859919.1 hypothetical protein [Emcibacteraceae bacterium]